MIIQDRDCGDETDTLHERPALTALIALCPRCLAHLARPDRMYEWSVAARPRSVAVQCDQPWCRQRTNARFYEEQR